MIFTRGQSETSLSALTAAETAVDFTRREFMELPLYGLAIGRSVLYTFDGVINFESDNERKAKTLSVVYREGVLELCGYDVLMQHDSPHCSHRST